MLNDNRKRNQQIFYHFSKYVLRQIQNMTMPPSKNHMEIGTMQSMQSVAWEMEHL